jgi:hypothetical protein
MRSQTPHSMLGEHSNLYQVTFGIIACFCFPFASIRNGFGSFALFVKFAVLLYNDNGSCDFTNPLLNDGGVAGFSSVWSNENFVTDLTRL